MKVRCKKDFGFFMEGQLYYVMRMVNVHECGINDSIWEIFFGEEPSGAARHILGSDLESFFETIKEGTTVK